MDKENVVHTHTHTHTHTLKYYSAIKKKEVLSYAIPWMDLESIILRELSHTKKDKCHKISLLHGT